MNILHIKYAVEVARIGSLNKAAESLFVAQPNISRSIKELEADLGITIFERSAKGMVLTEEGEEFIVYAKEILRQIENVEKIYKDNTGAKQRFAVCSVDSCYISQAFAEFSRSVQASEFELTYKKSDTQGVISDVVENDFRLGVIRYPFEQDKYYKTMLEEKGLSYELVADFGLGIAVSKESVLAGKDFIADEDIEGYIELIKKESGVGISSPTKNTREERLSSSRKKIVVYDSSDSFEVLSCNKDTYMYTVPLPRSVLDSYGLVWRPLDGKHSDFRDVLIYREGYRLSKADRDFVTSLCEAKRRCDAAISKMI